MHAEEARTLPHQWGGVTFDTAANPGDAVTVSVGSAAMKMIYTNNQASITFPRGETDASTATLTAKFFTGETEVTNAVAAEVLQWAYDNGKIVETGGAHNEVSSTVVKYGTKTLMNLSNADCKINYSSGSFTVDSGYGSHPIVAVSWYGAVMICNWLTEMKDGNSDNLVYSGIDTTMDYTEITGDTLKTGYRLLSIQEWEFAARFIGTTAPTAGNLATESVYYNKGGGFLTLTSDYYWTPGDYASGASKDSTNATETEAVGQFTPLTLQAVKGKTANQLGIYDMSGNAAEWTFTIVGGSVNHQGGCFSDVFSRKLAAQFGWGPDNNSLYFSFRLAKTK